MSTGTMRTGRFSNVADIAICVGVGLFLLSSLLRKPKKAAEENEAAVSELNGGGNRDEGCPN